LSLAEAKAVARPFFTQGAMTDTDALALVGKLQERIEVTPEERRIILLSVIQSELISDEEVMQLELWIEQANPSMKVIESKAEQFRNRRITELRLFPNVRGLLKTANDYRVGSPSVTPWTMIIILNAFGVAVALVFLGLRRTVT